MPLWSISDLSGPPEHPLRLDGEAVQAGQAGQSQSVPQSTQSAQVERLYRPGSLRVSPRAPSLPRWRGCTGRAVSECPPEHPVCPGGEAVQAGQSQSVPQSTQSAQMERLYRPGSLRASPRAPSLPRWRGCTGRAVSERPPEHPVCPDGEAVQAGQSQSVPQSTQSAQMERLYRPGSLRASPRAPSLPGWRGCTGRAVSECPPEHPVCPDGEAVQAGQSQSVPQSTQSARMGRLYRAGSLRVSPRAPSLPRWRGCTGRAVSERPPEHPVCLDGETVQTGQSQSPQVPQSTQSDRAERL